MEHLHIYIAETLIQLYLRFTQFWNQLKATSNIMTEQINTYKRVKSLCRDIKIYTNVSGSGIKLWNTSNLEQWSSNGLERFRSVSSYRISWALKYSESSWCDYSSKKWYIQFLSVGIEYRAEFVIQWSQPHDVVVW